MSKIVDVLMKWQIQTVEIGTIKEVWVLITPDRARQLLEYASNIRPTQRSSVKDLARYLINKQWRDRANPDILVGKDGRLMDGHHRLTAMASVNEGEWLQAFRLDGTKMDLTVKDSGRVRTLNQRIQKDVKVGATLKAIHHHGARDRAKKKWNTFSALAYGEYYKDSVDVINNILKDKYTLEKSVLVRAHKSGGDETREKIIKLAKILNGDSETLFSLNCKDGQTANKIQKYFWNKGSEHRNSEPSREDIVRRFEFALRHFVNGEELNNFCRQSAPIWPVPIDYLEEQANKIDEKKLAELFGRDAK